MLLRLTTIFHSDLAYPTQITTSVPSIIGMSRIGEYHCMVSRSMLSRLIWSSGLWRFPV